MVLLRDQVVALRREQKRGVGILCAEWRKEETEELTAWFHLSLARGHAEPVVAQNGVCSAVRQINLCRLEKQQGSAEHTCTYYLYTITVYYQLVHMIRLMFGHHQHRNLLSKRGHSRLELFSYLGNVRYHFLLELTDCGNRTSLDRSQCLI
jgi:hypothetical protein